MNNIHIHAYLFMTTVETAQLYSKVFSSLEEIYTHHDSSSEYLYKVSYTADSYQ